MALTSEYGRVGGILGKIIVLFGIPGSGKSSLTREIGKQLSVPVFQEPEESEWSEAVRFRQLSGNFTAMMWFRSIRVPLLYQAVQMKTQFPVVFLDAFFDKLFYLYMDTVGMEWMFDKTDIYYDELKNIARKDYHLLPDADILVFLKVPYEVWCCFLDKRNRNREQEQIFRNSFQTQESYLAAASQYCQETDTQLIVYEQQFQSPDIAASELIAILKSENIV